MTDTAQPATEAGRDLLEHEYMIRYALVRVAKWTDAEAEESIDAVKAEAVRRDREALLDAEDMAQSWSDAIASSDADAVIFTAKDITKAHAFAADSVLDLLRAALQPDAAPGTGKP